MSRENVEVMERGVRHFVKTGEPDLSTLHPEIEVHDHDIPDAGTYRGHRGYEKWLADWAAAWQNFSIEPEEYIDAGERVVLVIRLRATGRGSGLELDRQDGLVFTMRDGLAVRLDYYGSKGEALEAVGLRE
jgi:ketosteroid isomerase-like protein